MVYSEDGVSKPGKRKYKTISRSKLEAAVFHTFCATLLHHLHLLHIKSPSQGYMACGAQGMQHAAHLIQDCQH